MREFSASLLVEQNVERALGVSDRAYTLDHSTVVHHADARTLLADQAIQDRYLLGLSRGARPTGSKPKRTS